MTEKQFLDENGTLQGWQFEKVSQVEAGYKPYGAGANKGCATCRFWNPHMQNCHVVDGVIVATGLSDMYLAITPDELAGEAAEDIAEYTEALDRDGLIEYLNEAFDDESDKSLFPTESGFKVLNDNLWVGWYTNAYKDREKEFFPEKEIEKDVKAMIEGDDYPELRFWHIKTTRHGKGIAAAKVGRFAVTIGEFEDTPYTEAFKAYYEKTPHLAMSHGFTYDPKKKKDGAYYDFHTFEVSVLPVDSAANPYTIFSLQNGEKEMAVQLNEKAKAALISILGKDETEKLIQQGEKQTEALDNAGVAYKETEESEKAEMPMEEEEDTKTILKKLAKRLDDRDKIYDKRMSAIEKRFMPPKEEEEEKPAKKEVSEAPRAEQAKIIQDERLWQALADRILNGEKERLEEREKVLASPFEALANALLPKAGK